VSADWLVLKFGGTSVSGRAQWEAIAALARQRLDDGHRVVLVCSAVSGITDALQGLLDHAAEGAEERLDEIRRRHHRLARELGVKSGDLVDRAMDDISRLLPGIADTTHDSNRYRAIASLLSLGEWLSTRIGARFLAQRLPVEWPCPKRTWPAVAPGFRPAATAGLTGICRGAGSKNHRC
jgi:diaminopimelate decarboxylase/aspartate kinase